MRPIITAAILALLSAKPAVAQMATPSPTPHPACPATPTPPPPEYAGWSAGSPLKGATSTRELGLATLQIGRPGKAALAATATLAYPIAPDHVAAPGSFGGLFGFTVTEAGTYRVALGAGAWLDVVKDGAAVRSSAHGHGPDCSAVRKTVDFPLQPGRYVLQLSGATGPALTLMVMRLPA